MTRKRKPPRLERLCQVGSADLFTNLQVRNSERDGGQASELPEQPVLSSEIRTKLQFRRCFPTFSLFLVFHLPFFRYIFIPYINESDLSPRNMFSSTDVMYFMLTLKPGLQSRCILAHPRVLCALFLCLSFRSCATFSLSLIYVCRTVGPLFNIILQRSMSIIQQRIQKALAFLKISLYGKYQLPRQGCSDPLQSTI